MNTEYIIGKLTLADVNIPIVESRLGFNDFIGSVKVRWSINRNSYRVSPGLYAIGKPDSDSNVFVTANYKLSFDHLRKNLKGFDAWILVLDTKGINVWCAAGKGTFGTDELLRQIRETKLEQLINHKKLIVPQLGAVGVSAFEVKKQSGFSVIFGPVQAEDLPKYITDNLKATKEMRTVYFRFTDRLKLIPVEIVGHSTYMLFAMAAFFILAGLNPHGYSLDNAFSGGMHAGSKILIAFFCGSTFMPMLLPYIPHKSFSLKGGALGLIAAIVSMLLIPDNGIWETLSWFFMIPAISSFIAMNFTGTSTYTSLSGVMKEMKIAIPLQLIFSIIGLSLWIISRFVI